MSENKLVCEVCGGTNDTIDFYRGEEYYVMCFDCRVKIFARKVGVSKIVSKED